VIPAAPAGALAASGGDLGRFMLAHLQDGQYRGQSILQPATVLLMHARQFGVSPGLNGMALGFYEENRNGLEIVGHGGERGISGFHATKQAPTDRYIVALLTSSAP